MKILLIGQMGSGKDTAANYLAAKYNLYPEKLGKYIRNHIDEMFFDISTDQRRSFYQAYGEGMREIFGPLIWCERLIARLNCNSMIDDLYNGVVITDCRQDHEIGYFRERGFTLLAIDADSLTRIKRLTERDGNEFNVESFTHSTEENASRLIDRIKTGVLSGYVANNSGDEQSLYEQLDEFIEQVQCSGVTV